MSSISNSIYGSTANKGVGGLLSGLDTDDLVNKMTAATRNKINRQYQAKQKLLYRQEAYREISSKLKTFSDKYFSYASGLKTNILSAGFFEAYTFKSSSNYVNVTGNAENIKNFSINNISQVATAATYTSTVSASSTSISSDYDIKGNVSALIGATMSIKLDDKIYNLKLDDEFIEDNKTLSVNDVVDQLNKQLATIEGNETLDKLKYTSDGNKIKFNTLDGRTTATLVAASNSITNILKMEVNTTAETKGVDIVLEDLVRDTAEVFSDPSNYITFEYNGLTKKINLNDGLTNGTSLETYLKTKLDEAYGAGKVTVNFDEIDNKFTFMISDNINNTLRVSGISSELSRMIGIESGDGNRLNTSVAINSINNLKGLADYSITVNGKLINIDDTMSINDIMKKINSESDINITYSSTTDKFIIKSKETGENSKINISGVLADKLFGTNITNITGQDTKMNITINGQNVDITRSTDNFAIDGINIELNEKAAGSVVVGSPITFDVTNNVDDVVEKVKKFIDDYNEIITLIGIKTKEKPNSKYPPLTPDQQEEMKEKEIENWNKEATKGVLFGDRKMTALLSDLRISLMGKTDVSDLALSNIGISAAAMDTSGKLVLDEKKFKEKLMEKPDEIIRLFTGTKSDEGSKQGLAIQVRDILYKNIGAFGNSGVLIDEAGLDGGLTSDKNNISKKIKEHDDKMEALKRALEVERKRYWNQFSALEQSLNKLNAQSSWLTDMMG